jgi:outer membrane receptor protein involved in Fe transport
MCQPTVRACRCTQNSVVVVLVGIRKKEEEWWIRVESEPYVLSGFLGYRPGHVSLFLNGENLADARQTQWTSVLRPDRGVDGRWAVATWVPPDGRVFNGGVRLSL